MTDRELLERAARAAGIRALWGPDGICRDATGAAPAMNLFGMPRWDPLADDGDALRLAVALGFITPGRWPDAGLITLEQWGEDGCKADWYAATRRAIVRAAAEMAP